jgi:trimeric autotransporter adhesin
MSIKTLKKRVALATVVALGAGVLSLISGTSANASSTNQLISSSVNPDGGIGYLNIANLNSTTGSAVLPSAQSATGIQAARSQGLLAVDDLAGDASKSTNPSAGVTGIATLLSTGTLTVYDSQVAVANKFQSVVVSGATITSAMGSGIGTSTLINSSNTAAVDSATIASPVFGLTIKPNSGVSSFTVSFYDTVTSSDNTLATALTAPTSGTLVSFYTVAVAAAGSAGVVSSTKSNIYYMGNTGGYLAGTTGLTSDTTTGTPGTSAWNVAQIADVRVRDAYGTVLTGGLLTVSATNGAYVAITASNTNGSSGPATTANSSSTPYLSGTYAGDNDAITVLPSVTTASSTTVTVSYNGVVVGVKSFSFTGLVAKVVLSSPGNGTVSQNPNLSSLANPNYGNVVTAKFLDSAGNQVYPASGSSSYPSANVAKDALTSGSGISYTAANSYYPAAASSTQVYSCGSLNATGSFAIDYTNVDGSLIVSNVVPVSCSGTAASYTAKLDKTNYAPGDIATLTVTFKDSNGALASDQTNTIATSGNTTTLLPAIYAGTALILTGGYSATTAGNSTDATTNGVKKYTFIAGNTSGSYALNVDFPQVDAVSGQSGIQVPFTIADGSTSLNDVLKGIVSLIASINKQIAALAKLVTKK